MDYGKYVEYVTDFAMRKKSNEGRSCAKAHKSADTSSTHSIEVMQVDPLISLGIFLCVPWNTTFLCIFKRVKYEENTDFMSIAFPKH